MLVKKETNFIFNMSAEHQISKLLLTMHVTRYFHLRFLSAVFLRQLGGQLGPSLGIWTEKEYEISSEEVDLFKRTLS